MYAVKLLIWMSGKVNEQGSIALPDSRLVADLVQHWQVGFQELQAGLGP
jgi:hypothetical protein